MKRKNTLVAALLFLCYAIQAQYIPKVLPPSPNAYSLYKIKDVEIDKMSGTANFSIPIFEIIQDGVSIPIQISYNTGGIRVDERSSSVGLGWGLNIPYDITKQVHGYDDDNKFLFLPHKNYYIPSNHPNSLPSFDYSKINTSTSAGITQNFSFLSALFENSITGEVYDTQPDMYYYKLGSLNGKFFRDTKLKSRLIPYQPIEILSFSPMKIQDFESNTYEFERTLNFVMKDRCSSFSLLDDFSGINNYKISNITTKSKTNILFSYNHNESSVLRGVFEMKDFKIPSPSTDNAYLPGVSINCQPYKEEHNSLITEIIFDQGRIEFKYNTVRNDLESLSSAPAKSLDEIIIYSKGNRVIKKASFSYGYFTSSLYVGSNTYNNKRLKLKSVKVGDQTHEFEYYEDTPLPAVNSNTADYWGYFNGKMSITRIPQIFFRNTLFEAGADREADSTAVFTRAMSLKKIKYPTKGSLEMIYENNNYYGEKTKYTKHNIGADDENPPVFFTLNEKTSNRKLYFMTDYTGPSGGFGNGPCIGRVWRKNNQGNFELAGQFTDNGTFSNTLNQNGEYKLEIANYGDEKCFLSAEYIKEEKKIGEFAAGGLRLQALKYYDHNSSLVKQKQFQYVSDSLGHTSSIAVRFPSFISDRMVKVKEGTEYVYKQQYLISSDANSNHSLNPGSSVLYTQVDEFLSDSGSDNGRIKYFNYIDSELRSTSLKNDFSYTFDDWKNHTHRTEFYNAQNILQEYNQYFYKTYRTKNQLSEDSYGKYIGYALHKGFSPPLSFQAMTADDFNNLPNFQYLLEQISFFGFDSGLRFLAESRNYKILDGKTILTKENREFRNLAELPHLLLSDSTTDPDGSVTESKYQYAHEKGNQLMISKNMVGIPLETTVSQTIDGKTKVLSKVETVYPTALSTPQTGNLVLPLSIKSYDALNSNISYDEVKYDKYDEKGNLVQYTMKDGTAVTIVWGYNKTQPIAQIEGMTYDEVMASASPTTIISASDNDAADPGKEGALLTALKNFRKQSVLFGKKITTYTYDPLIGVTSITPPSGVREVYIYDTTNRLKEVKVREKDSSGIYVLKTLKQFNYNYKQ